ncbi:uncharacterized protein LOC6566615 [Drosophila grimshawi]|uniref:uncharacterized protein LOC6566615 n=1 Tax=Drosophila grimshawi TaxID=7222 RepID=UPI000C8703C1|nr:uncharacterized protein LOC6566615 [Drosophila grimshawi]
MCKFTNHLFVLLLLHVVGQAVPKPLNTRSLATDFVGKLYDDDYDDDGYQVDERYYDQRQQGNQNWKVSLDDFVISLPNSEGSSWMEILGAEYLDYALAVKK